MGNSCQRQTFQAAFKGIQSKKQAFCLLSVSLFLIYAPEQKKKKLMMSSGAKLKEFKVPRVFSCLSAPAFPSHAPQGVVWELALYLIPQERPWQAPQHRSCNPMELMDSRKPLCLLHLQPRLSSHECSFLGVCSICSFSESIAQAQILHHCLPLSHKSATQIYSPPKSTEPPLQAQGRRIWKHFMECAS